MQSKFNVDYLLPDDEAFIKEYETHYFEYILIRLKDDVFRDMLIVANPWVSDDLMLEIYTALNESTLSEDIKKTIIVQRSELDGQIVRRDG